MTGDPEGMRRLAAMLKFQAEQAADVARSCVTTYEATVFEGPAARRIDDRVATVSREVTEQAEVLTEVANRLLFGAARVEDEQRADALRRQREEQQRAEAARAAAEQART